MRYMFFAIAVLVAITGCGQDSAGVVTGTVTHQKSPVTSGTVFFSNDELGIHLNATIQVDGSYQVFRAGSAGLPPGTYQVAVKPPIYEMPVGGDPSANKPPPFDVPEKYHDISTSGLETTVVAVGCGYIPVEHPVLRVQLAFETRGAKVGVDAGIGVIGVAVDVITMMVGGRIVTATFGSQVAP